MVYDSMAMSGIWDGTKLLEINFVVGLCWEYGAMVLVVKMGAYY